jgi:hypothetical protein
MKYFLFLCQGQKPNFLRIFGQSFSVLDGDKLKEKTNLKIYSCSKKVFWNFDKKTQDNESVMWLVWNHLFKWTYSETRESEPLCILRKRTCRCVLRRDTTLLFFFFVNIKAIYSINSMPTLHNLKTVLKTIYSNIPLKRDQIF